MFSHHCQWWVSDRVRWDPIIPPLLDPDRDVDPVDRVDSVDLVEVDLLVDRVDWVDPVDWVDRVDLVDRVALGVRRDWIHSPRAPYFPLGRASWAS